jgi:tRNA pseudouridine65 synthase
MLLHALRLDFAHPVSGEAMGLEAPLDATWQQLLQRFEWADAAASALPSSS